MANKAQLLVYARRGLIAGLIMMLVFANRSGANAGGMASPNSGNARMAGCAAIDRLNDTGKTPTTPDGVLAMGVCMGMLNASLAFLADPDGSCVSKEITVGQLAAVVNKFMRDHPEVRHEDFIDIVRGVAKITWPCAKTNGQSF
jgi:hypothetical protein